MPLVKCPDCGNDVSTRATACPKCGAPIAGSGSSSSDSAAHTADATRSADGTVYLPSSPQARASAAPQTHGPAPKKIGIFLLVALTVIITIASVGRPPSSGSRTTSTPTAEPVAATRATAPTYWVAEEWPIPNGGFGRTIVLDKQNPSEQELRALGEVLQRATRSDRNAFIFVYDDPRAAAYRKAAMEERLSPAQMQQHDQHLVAHYRKIGTTHDILLHPSGLNGPEVVVQY